MMTTTRIHRANRGSHFRAYGLHGSNPAQLDPFMGIDHAWMSAPTFPPHPHAGFSAVTYVFLDSETGIANRDSQGNRTLIQPGGLHWTAAGRGVIHEENPAVPGHTVHLLQIFVNLPQSQQRAAPFALTLSAAQVPLVQREGVRVRVPLGQFEQARSPLAPPTEVTLLEVTLADGAEIEVPVAAGHKAFVLPIFGQAHVNDEALDLDRLSVPVFHVIDQDQSLKLVGGSAGATVAVFIGRPLHQAMLSNGPMAFADPHDLAKATAAYQRGEMGNL